MIVLVAMFTPFLVLLIALAVEIGNWYVHKRHLQVRVDATALAAAQDFGLCISNPGGAYSQMQTDGNAYWDLNEVFKSSARGTIGHAYQTKTYPAPNLTVEDGTAEGTDPCTSGMLDVKATETGIPHLFKIPGLVTVRAHARVQLRRVSEMKGLLPVAVPDVHFNYAFATFIDETTGQPPAGCGACTEQLQKGGTSGGLQLWTAQTPISVPITSAHIGVRLRLVAGTDPNAACDALYTECYDATSANGVVHIRGWSSSAAPAVQNAWLLAGSCTPDAYFTTSNCSAGVQAQVDLGTNHPLSGNGALAHVWATVDGGATKYQLTQGTGSGLVTWTLNGGVPITGPGGHQISLAWDWQQTAGTWNGLTCTNNGGNKCKDTGSFGYVQRAFVSSVDASGPVQQVQVFESGVSSSGANSFAQGSSHSLGVTIAAPTNLRTQALATDPVIYLRVTGSQNQSVDCDPNKNLRVEIATGCDPIYTLNSTLDCSAYPNGNAWPTFAQPWNCVKTQTGNAVGQVEAGLKDRILGGSNSCSAAPINYPNYTQDDKRIIPLIITPFGSFSGSGNANVPVIDFGAFYVMGWDGDPCPNSVPVPRKGYIAGHFIKYIPRAASGSGETNCFLTDPTQITPCVAVLTG